MAELKKIPFSAVTDDVITMSFAENPNIPTANYSDETLKKINDKLQKTMKAEKLAKMIEQELKTDKKTDEIEGFSFSFKGM